MVNRTVSPTLICSPRRVPSLSSLPGPTARTFPFCGLFLAVSGRRMPPVVFSSALKRCTTMRSPSGFRPIWRVSGELRTGAQGHPDFEWGGGRATNVPDDRLVQQVHADKEITNQGGSGVKWIPAKIAMNGGGQPVGLTVPFGVRRRGALVLTRLNKPK